MSNTPTVAIVANGQIHDYAKILKKLETFDLVIAADGGSRHCLKMGITPDLIMGDFDSTDSKTMEAFSDVPQIKFLIDKNETDLELALNKAFSLNSEKIVFFGATGDRTDHTLVNLLLLSRFPGKVLIENENETIFAIVNEAVFDTIPGQTISLLPLVEDVEVAETQGLKWELKDAVLNDNFFSISNVCLKDRVAISVKTGVLICFLQSSHTIS